MTLFDNGIVLIHKTPPRGTVTMLHGLTSSPAEMKDFAMAVHQAGFNVFLSCLTGHAQTIEAFKRVPARRWLCDAEQSFHEARRASPGPQYVIGLSFGALLSLHVTEMFPELISGLIVLSPPIRLRSRFEECVLSVLSHAPEGILDCLGVVKKAPRPEGTFVIPRAAYEVHALGAAARIVSIRKRVIERLTRVTCPLLVLHDPEDHHVSTNAVELLRSSVRSSEISTKFFAGGQHELTIGPFHQEVSRAAIEWLSRDVTVRRAPHAA